jgi:hypothetical protein
MKKISKKWLLIIVIIVILILFFSPKSCGNWGTAISPDAKYKDCVCIGIKYSPPVIGGAYITCFGIPVSYSCYYYEGKEIQGTWEVEKINITCFNECELHGGKCYGFGDFVAENCEDHGMITSSYKCPVPITINTQCCMKK